MGVSDFMNFISVIREIRVLKFSPELEFRLMCDVHDFAISACALENKTEFNSPAHMVHSEYTSMETRRL